jgi:hypothetical protein
MNRLRIAAVLSFLVLQVSRGTELYAAPVTFNKEIAPILFKHCASCHRPDEVAPFSLLTYADAAKRAEQIVEIIERRAMPPWKPTGAQGTFLNDRRLTTEEIALVKQWVADGAAEGDGKDLPPPPKFAVDWQLGKPDLVLTVPEPIDVPADGRDIYMNVVLPLKLPAGKYLKAAEFRPGNHHVVHHAILLIDVEGKARERDRASRGQGFVAIAPPGTYLPGALGVWTPGRVPRALPDGLAMPWPDNGDLVLNLHLHPTGKAETEQSSVGFYFTDQAPKRPLLDLTLFDVNINIPAGEKAYRTHDRKVVPVESDVMTVFPHMHMLGRSMTITAHHPNGGLQTLLEINDWDYNWQDLYQFATPVRLPAGTVITMDAVHDNSADNPQNPRHPPARVKWGEQSENEMSTAFLSMSPVSYSAAIRPDGQAVDPMHQQALNAWRKADGNGDGRLSAMEIMGSMGRNFTKADVDQIITRFDQNGDKQLNFDEYLAVLQAGTGR